MSLRKRKQPKLDKNHIDGDSSQIVVMQQKKLFGLTSRKMIIFVLIGVLLLGTVISGLWLLRSKSDSLQAEADKVAFVVDGTSYSKDQIKELTTYAVTLGGKPDEAAKQAFEMYKRAAAAKKTGVTISDDELKQAQQMLYPSASDETLKDSWVNMSIYDQALQNLRTQTDYYSDAAGDIYVLWFGQRIDYNPDQPIDGFGDEALVKKDRAYAQQQAEYYHDSLKSGKLAPADALKGIKADTRLGYGDVANSNPSVHFDSVDSTKASDSALASIDPTIIESIITDSAKAGVGDIQIGTVKPDMVNSRDESQGLDPQEVYFYFVYIERPATHSFSVAAYTKALDKIEATYEGI